MAAASAASEAAGNEVNVDFSFLDFSDCNEETKSYLLDLLDSKPKVKQQPPIPQPPAPQQPPHFQQVYAAPTATSQPLVYINNVTANVNVHHGGQVPPEPAAGQPAGSARPIVSHSGFPPPPPNPMPAYPAANAGPPPPAGLILPPQNPQFIYHQPQFAALAKTAGPHPQPYMHAPQVIYYPYPIPVSTGQPQVQPQQRLRSSPTMLPPPMMAPTPTTAASEQPYLVQPQVQTVPQQTVPPAVEPQVTKPQEPQQPAVAKEEIKKPMEPVKDIKPQPPAATDIPQPKEPQIPAENPQPPKSTESSETEEPKTKSWASLFQKDIPVNIISSNKPMARIQPYTMPEGPKAEPKKKETNDDLEMAKFLQDYNLTHRSNMIKPRGLSNRSNWCFVNAILQALVACPPFYNLMKAMPLEILKKASMTKITKVVQEFFAEFAPLDHFPKLNRRDKSKKNEDLPVGMTFEASSIFQFLLGLTSDTFKVEEGRQEDAEEFLTFFLNALNDEMLALLKLLLEEEEDENEGQNEGQEDGLEWHEVGAKNRSLLTRRVGNSNETIRTPVGHIFQGQIQSCVTSSNGEPTATLQPFFTLPLDIQSKSIKNVSDALIHNFTAETLDG